MVLLHYEETKYPRIYKDTYWGGFRRSDTTPEPDIIENRNKFVEEYRIYKRAKCPQRLQKFWTGDHTELYQDASRNYIMITSPYGPLDFIYNKYPDLKHWKIIYPMYTTNATTFMIELPKSKNPSDQWSRGEPAFKEIKCPNCEHCISVPDV